MHEKRIVIFGGKGTAINIAEQIEDARLRFGIKIKVIGFAIDDPSLGSEIAGFPVVCRIHDAWSSFKDTDVEFIFALYRPDVMFERLELLYQLGIPPLRFTNFIHPSVYLSPSVSLGYGNVILSQSCLQSRVSLGNYNIINSNVMIEHESNILDGSFVAACSCIGARVQIGTGAFIGLNSTIRENVTIADYSFVGMAAGVLRSVYQGEVVYGLPARKKQ